MKTKGIEGTGRIHPFVYQKELKVGTTEGKGMAQYESTASYGLWFPFEGAAEVQSKTGRVNEVKK